MAGWNNKNCCCEPKTYTCGNGEVNICCMVLEVSTWARPVTFYATGYDPDDVCGYFTGPYSHNNHCGSLKAMLCSAGSVGGFSRAEILWGIQADGTVKLEVIVQSSHGAHESCVVSIRGRVEGLDPDTWYLSPVTFTSTVSGETCTVSLCPDPHEPFPEWPPTDVFMKIGKMPSTGTKLCGAICNVRDPDGVGVNPLLWWQYCILTDKIIFTASGVSAGRMVYGLLEVDYDDGNWIHNSYSITLTGVGVPDITTTITPADSCVIPPPPPPCEVSNACFPDGCPCIIDGSDGSLFRDLVADVSGPVTHTGISLLVNGGGDGWEYNAGPDSLVIQCTNGGLDPYYVAAVFGGVNYFFSIPAGGIDCDPDDTNQILDITLTDGTITIRIYTL